MLNLLPRSPGLPGGQGVAVFDDYWGATLAFAAALGRRGVALQVYGKGAARWSRYAHTRRACPPLEDAARFLPWLQQRIRCGEITRVAPTTDLIAYYVSVLRDEFPAAVRRAIPPLEEIETALIKTRFAARCAQIGQAVPAMAAPVDRVGALAAAATLGYPLILKPKSHLVVGWVERGVVVFDEADLARAFRPYPVVPGQEQLAARYPELQWPLLQRFIPAGRGRVYSVSGFKDQAGGIVTACVSYKQEQWPRDVGASTTQVACGEARVLQEGLAAIGQLLTCGIFELELVTDGAALLAIDLNPRAFGFMNLDIARGNDLPWLWYQSTSGPVAPYPEFPAAAALEARLLIPYWTGRVARRLIAGPGRSPRPRLPAALRTAWVSMLGSGDDPLPLLLGHLRLLRHPRGLLRPYLDAAWSARRAAATRGREPAAERPLLPRAPQTLDGR